MYNQLPIHDNFDMIVIILVIVSSSGGQLMSEFIVDLVQKLILDILDNLGIPDNMVNPLYYTIFAAFIILVCIALELFGRWVILSLFYRITKNSRRPIFSFLKKHRLLSRIIHLISPFVISLFSSAFGKAESWVSHAMTIHEAVRFQTHKTGNIH